MGNTIESIPKIGVLMLSAILLIGTLFLLAGCADEQMHMTFENITDPIDITRIHEHLPGTWEGTVLMGGSTYPVRFSLQQGEYDEFIGVFSIPNQEPVVFVFDEAHITKDGEITFHATSIHTGYTATLRAVQESNTITLSGTWQFEGSQTHMGTERHHIERLTLVDRPQEPIPPFPYREEEVVFTNSCEGINLAGTFTYPEKEGPFPTVILVSGSGAHDRNEKISGHRPFLVLADYLTRHGIAVLRYDDRGAGESEGNAKTANSHDLSMDAEAALDYLLERGDVVSDMIGIIGHSEGGMIGPMVADRRDEVSFLVLLAGPGVQGYKVLLSQTRAILEAQNLPKMLIETTLSTNEYVYQLILEEEDLGAIHEEIYRTMRKVGVSDSQIEQQISSIILPWFQFFIRYDPGEVLSRTTIPVFAAGGSLDLQVVSEKNLPAIASHLEEAGNPHVKTKLYEGLNHLFQPAKTGMVDEYESIAVTIDPEVLKDITSWILDLWHEEKTYLSIEEHTHPYGRE